MARWLRLGPLERLPQRQEVAEAMVLADLEVGAERIVFTAPVAFTGAVRRLADGAALDGQAVAQVRLRCGRCLDTFAAPLVGRVEARYRLDPRGDDEALPYREAVDLEPPVEEALVLALPVRPLCREDCPGLCPQCGRRRDDPQCRCTAPGDPRWQELTHILVLPPEEES